MYVKHNNVSRSETYRAEHIVPQVYLIGEADISCAVRRLRQITIFHRRTFSIFAGDCDLCGGRMICLRHDMFHTIYQLC